jgi:hypothetical protein
MFLIKGSEGKLPYVELFIFLTLILLPLGQIKWHLAKYDHKPEIK